MNPTAPAAARLPDRIVITGPDQEGVGFLAQLLGELGIRVGPSPESPVVVDPAAGARLGQTLADNGCVIDHVYIPIPDARDGGQNGRPATAVNPASSASGPETNGPAERPAVLAETFFQLIHTLTLHEVPYTLLCHPRLVGDWAYAYHKLWPLVKTTHPEHFRAAFARIAAAARDAPARPSSVPVADGAGFPTRTTPPGSGWEPLTA